jgi:hypothetical protein
MHLMRVWLATLLSLAISNAAVAQERLTFPQTGTVQVIDGEITGNEAIDYLVTAEGSQILSVDLMETDGRAFFNIQPQGDPVALFVGSRDGNVADIPAPADGAYIIRVYQMRASARRGETAGYSIGIGVGPPEFADGLSGGPDYWAVTGISAESKLNLRAGPDTRYAVTGQLDLGDVLQNQGCRLTGDMRWCRIRETGTGLAGWVAGQFLSETAPPPAPSNPEGLIGIGIPYDATGSITCNLPAEAEAATCPFGVIRQGPGNAGVWITLPGERQQQLLFENGELVTGSPADTFTVERVSNDYIVSFSGNRFVIPQAVVFGG